MSPETPRKEHRAARDPLGMRLALLLLAVAAPVYSAERAIGDIDNDGRFTVLDLTRQIAHIRNTAPLPDAEKNYSDVNRDGVYNEADTEALVLLILADTGFYDPVLADTDRDGWNDATEIEAGSNPFSPASRPTTFFVGTPVVAAALPSTAEVTPAALGTTIARPVIDVALPSIKNEPIPGGAFLALPPVAIALPSSVAEPLLLGSFLARPPVAVALPANASEPIALGSFVARPPVALSLPATTDVTTPSLIVNGAFLAQPPVNLELPRPSP